MRCGRFRGFGRPPAERAAAIVAATWTAVGKVAGALSRGWSTSAPAVAWTAAMAALKAWRQSRSQTARPGRTSPQFAAIEGAAGAPAPPGGARGSS